MLALTDKDAYKHPAYEDGVAQAIRLAVREGGCWSVYYDGKSIFVRGQDEMRPPDSKLICIAQVWDIKTVQLRFDGARSEWRKI